MPSLKAGEFRVARADGAEPRLILILDEHEDEDFCNVALVTNELRMVTEADVRISAEESGLRYDVLVQTNIVGPLFNSQLGPALGQLPQDLADVILDGDYPDLSSLPPTRRGLPCVSQADQRGVWKRSELALLHRLSAACVASEL